MLAPYVNYLSENISLMCLMDTVLRMRNLMDEEFLNREKAAAYVRDKGLPCTKATLSKLASVGGGPNFYKFGRYAVYLPFDLRNWITARLSGPKTSTSDHTQSEAGANSGTPCETPLGVIQ